MKLELKHIVGYLPYRLKGLINNSGNTLVELSTYLSNKELKWTIDMFLGDSNVKPILRPLSDLKKEIEVNGEKFVPIIELAKLFHIPRFSVTHYGDIKDCGYYGIQVSCYVENDNNRFSYYQIDGGEFILKNSYEVIQKIYEWHFDVHDLIKNNLAIDINTLK